jgi:hypothetical protein
MAFSNYKTVDSVLKEFQVTYNETDFIIEINFQIPDYFREDLSFIRQQGAPECSEYAICENLIYPLLKEVWKKYYTKFVLWSHRSLNYDQKLSGFPEYILAKRSVLGKIVFDQPYLMLVEAKQDDFEAAWAQCLAEMIAAQKLNDDHDQEIFGIASNGKLWEFGKLKNNLFTKHQKSYLIDDLDKLAGAVNYIFYQCELLLN